LVKTFVVCDGEFYSGYSGSGFPNWTDTLVSFVACRGNYRGRDVLGAVLLVDGDVELSEGAEKIQDSLIRTSGEIRIPKNVKPVNCTIEPHAKNPTAPYKFFELADVGLTVADDEEGLVVRGAKPDTPFGDSGLAKGDVIRAIDDAPAGSCEQFRRAVRRALVRQGDCLVTVARGDKTIDLPVYFPLPK
jgi:type II secretory pathway component PulC